MSEFTWERFWTSIVATFLMKWAAIPPAVGPMVFLMFTDLLFGAGLALQQGSYENRKLCVGIMRKVAVFFILGALSAVTQEAFKLSWDPAEYFVRAVTIYEFLSCASKYRQIGGPGAPWIDRFAKLVESWFQSRSFPTQEQINSALKHSKEAGDRGRL